MSHSSFILVVEDETLIQPLIAAALEDAGYDALLTSDGAEAISILEDKGELVRALVTDVNLGGLVEGWDVAQRGRELNPSLPVVYMTGASAHEWASRGVPKSELLVKPFAPAELVTAVSSLLIEVNKLPTAEPPSEAGQ